MCEAFDPQGPKLLEAHICSKYLPCSFNMFGCFTTVIYMANIEVHPHPRFTFHPLEQQEVALNFARQHGGIAANELPDIVNFITQVPHFSSPKRETLPEV